MKTKYKPLTASMIMPTSKAVIALNRAGDRVAEEVIEEARLIYASKRKSDDPISLVIDSMTYNKSLDNMSINIHVFCDGVKAPHAKFVERDRTLRNGRRWKGYHFMQRGGEHGAKQAYNILMEELKKV